MSYETDVQNLDLLQRKASILIQGVSFFVSLQQEIVLRNRIITEYKALLETVLTPEPTNE